MLTLQNNYTHHHLVLRNGSLFVENLSKKEDFCSKQLQRRNPQQCRDATKPIEWKTNQILAH